METIKNILKKIFFGNTISYPLGVQTDENDIFDNRDIVLSTIQNPKILPSLYETDISMFPIWNQQMLGTCVAHSFALVKQYLDFKETSIKNIFSRRFLYVLARKFSQEDISKEGLSPRQAIKVLSTMGIIRDDGRDIDTLSHSQYVNDYVIDDIMKKDAIIYRSGGSAYPLIDSTSIKQAIYQNKVISATILIDFNRIDKDGTIHTPIKLAGLHQVVLCGWGNGKIKFRNSWGTDWGTNGYGYIPESELENCIYDALTIIDVPNDLIDRAKNMQFIFTTDLKYGSTGNAVAQLQKRLISYGLLGITNTTQYFGNVTLAGLKDYQRIKGIPITGICDKITRDMLNSETSQGQVKSKIDLWCSAIEKMEGSNPLWNNPGNLRYVGQKNISAIWDHSNKIKITDPSKFPNYVNKNSFCIFPSYAVGYKSLRDMLVRACTGLSSNYIPDMTLYEFYAGVPDKSKYGKVIYGYAPENDNNQPNHYAEFVANIIGVSPATKIKDLL